MPDEEPTHHQLAREFMAVRGYGDLDPYAVGRASDEPFLWYFDYRLDEGDLAIEVTWTMECGWSVRVWDFQTRDRRN
jgi:hypothetical protein